MRIRITLERTSYSSGNSSLTRRQSFQSTRWSSRYKKRSLEWNTCWTCQSTWATIYASHTSIERLTKPNQSPHSIIWIGTWWALGTSTILRSNLQMREVKRSTCPASPLLPCKWQLMAKWWSSRSLRMALVNWRGAQTQQTRLKIKFWSATKSTWNEANLPISPRNQVCARKALIWPLHCLKSHRPSIIVARRRPKIWTHRLRSRKEQALLITLPSR